MSPPPQYTFLLLFVFLLEAAAGVLAHVYEEQVKGELTHTLQGTFRTSYGTDSGATAAIDTLQKEVRRRRSSSEG